MLPIHTCTPIIFPPFSPASGPGLWPVQARPSRGEGEGEEGGFCGHGPPFHASDHLRIQQGQAEGEIECYVCMCVRDGDISLSVLCTLLISNVTSNKSQRGTLNKFCTKFPCEKL